MAKKRFSPEQVVAKLRQIEVLTAGGKALPLACKEAGNVRVTGRMPRCLTCACQLPLGECLIDVMCRSSSRVMET